MEAGGKYMLGRELQPRTSFLYADDGLVASMDLVWMQGAFVTLPWIFEKAGLQTNVRKVVGIFCHPFQAAGN